MRGLRLLVVAAVFGGTWLLGASAGGTMQSRWVIRELGTPVGHQSEARALNAAGQVVGGYAGGGMGGEHCFDAFLWQSGALKLVHPEQCVSGGDLCVSNRALAITRGGRVLGDTDRLCWTGGFSSYWLWPPQPKLESVFGATYPTLPDPAAWSSSRTCRLASGGRTVCGRYQPAYDARAARRCGLQHTHGVGIDDRDNLVASLSSCVDLGTGQTLGPETYVLVRPNRLTTFGPRGRARLTAINSAGDVVGAIPVPTGGSHAFVWNGRRIVDLGTLGGRDSMATAINDHGAVVGASKTHGGSRHAFLWRGSRMTDLGAGAAVAVNARGDVLGTRTEGRRLRVFIWQRGRRSDLGYWRDNPAFDDRGRVVGADVDGHAVVWEKGRRTRLPELRGGERSSALTANARAGIAGWSTNAKGVRRAVLWTLRSG